MKHCIMMQYISKTKSTNTFSKAFYTTTLFSLSFKMNTWGQVWWSNCLACKRLWVLSTPLHTFLAFPSHTTNRYCVHLGTCFESGFWCSKSWMTWGLSFFILQSGGWGMLAHTQWYSGVILGSVLGLSPSCISKIICSFGDRPGIRYKPGQNLTS